MTRDEGFTVVPKWNQFSRLLERKGQVVRDGHHDRERLSMRNAGTGISTPSRDSSDS